MARLLILPNDQLQIQLESPLPAAELAAAVNNGSLPEVVQLNYPGQPPALQAVCLGNQVIIFPANLQGSAEPQKIPPLSPRLRAILLGLAEGLTAGQIARRLRLSPRTVEHHIDVLRQRLGERNRLKLIARAAALGMIPSLPPAPDES